MSATQALRAAATGENKSPVASFRSFLIKQKAHLEAALPKHISPDRMIRLACTEFSRNRDLQKCTPISIFGAIIQASQLGLEIGVLGQAYLVPYKNKKEGTVIAQFIPGYKGLIALARRSGEVTSIETHIVYRNDTFNLSLGLDTNVEHTPYLEGDRGTPYVVYGVAKFRDGGHHFEWMPIQEVERIRARSRASNNGPWVTDYEQMVRKTLIRRMANYLPMSIELQTALQVSDAAEEGKHVTLDGDFAVIEDDENTIEAEAAIEDQSASNMPPMDIPTNIGNPGFEDAIAAVQSGDHDLARDLARSLPPEQQQHVETAIRNREAEPASAKKKGAKDSDDNASLI